MLTEYNTVTNLHKYGMHELMAIFMMAFKQLAEFNPLTFTHQKSVEDLPYFEYYVQSITLLTNNEEEHVYSCILSSDFDDEYAVFFNATTERIALNKNGPWRPLDLSWTALEQWLLNKNADKGPPPDGAEEVICPRCSETSHHGECGLCGNTGKVEAETAAQYKEYVGEELQRGSTLGENSPIFCGTCQADSVLVEDKDGALNCEMCGSYHEDADFQDNHIIK